MHVGLIKLTPTSGPSLEIVDFDFSEALVVMLLQVARGLLNVKCRVVRIIAQAISTRYLVVGQQVIKVNVFPFLNFLQLGVANCRGQIWVFKIVPWVVHDLPAGVKNIRHT